METDLTLQKQIYPFCVVYNNSSAAFNKQHSLHIFDQSFTNILTCTVFISYIVVQQLYCNFISFNIIILRHKMYASKIYIKQSIPKCPINTCYKYSINHILNSGFMFLEKVKDHFIFLLKISGMIKAKEVLWRGMNSNKIIIFKEQCLSSRSDIGLKPKFSPT